jgi:putative addiction module component (TIGR02574 family)
MTLLQKIENDAMTLSETDRAHLIHDLIESLEYKESDSIDYDKELQKRVKSIHEGTAIGVDAEEVFAQLENKYS